MKKAGSGSISQRHGSADPDPNSHQKCRGSATLVGGKASLDCVVPSRVRSPGHWLMEMLRLPYTPWSVNSVTSATFRAFV